MKVITNISEKLVGIPVEGGGNEPLLPDKTVVVQDDVAENDSIRIYEKAGYLTITDYVPEPAEAKSENLPADAEEKVAEAEPAAEVKAEKAGRRGRVSTKK